MDAYVQNLSELFKFPTSYRIPVFQRPYAWTKEKQWHPLWMDAKRITQRLLASDPKEKIPPHFMGAIVLQLQSAKPNRVVKRIVVDGQQRLTTLQLLIRAAEEVFQTLDDTPRSSRLSELTLNDETYQGGEGDSDTKVRQSNVNDLHSFQDAIRGLNDGSEPLRSIGQAYRYFIEEITTWINEEPAQRDAKSEALEKTLTEYLKIAIVDLDEDEKPHFIFSVLNARSEPLKESDHIKNTVMYLANVVDDAKKAKELWGIFDSNVWWRSNTQEGRYSRIHLDRFLNYWVIMRTRKEVTADNVSVEFNDLVDSEQSSIEVVTKDIRDSGQIYQDIEAARIPGIETFLRRVKTMEIGVAMPILMWLCATGIPDDVRRRSVQALESYLVRRMLCGVTSQGLNRLFVELLGKTKDIDPLTADQVIIDFLAGQTVANRIWPKDSLLHDSLVDGQFKGTIRRQIMVLEAIETYLRSDKTEDIHHSQLTREHIMPESWQRNWPLSEEVNGDEAADARDEAVQQIGNFTLVNGKLNSSLSNAPWHEKKQTLNNHTTLRLNWRLLENDPDVWDECTIAARSKELADIVIAVWPSSDKI